MGAVNTTYTFTATDTITSTKMNNIIDETVMTSDAVLGGSGGSGGLDIASGKLSISANAINNSRLATNSVASANIVDGTIVNDDINASAAIAGTKIAASFGNQNITANGNIGLEGTASDYTAAVLNNTSGVQTQLFSNANLSGGINTVTNHPMLLSTNNTERMRITASGNVGIGTSNPITPLHVNGGFKVTATENNNFSATVSNSGTTNAYGLIVESNDSAYALAVRDKSNVYRFRAGADGTVSMGGTGNSFNITADGNVGIGTTTPSSKLQVNGTVTATAFSGPLTGNVTGNVTGSSGSCTGNSATSTLATKASTLSNGGGSGNAMTFHYSGQGGTPTYVWGSNDPSGGNNNYVWSPANFSVNYANSAGSATTASTCTGNASSADYATRAALGPVDGTFTQNHTANNSKIYVGGFGTNKGFGIHCQRAANENSSALHFTKENGVVVGSIVLDTANSTNYNTTSDYRLKKDFYPISSGLSKVNLLKPTNFKWIDTDARTDGFIAHEVQDVFPNAVTGEKDAIDENGNPIYQQIDQSKLIPIMVAAIQELSRKVAELESR